MSNPERDILVFLQKRNGQVFANGGVCHLLARPARLPADQIRDLLNAMRDKGMVWISDDWKSVGIITPKRRPKPVAPNSRKKRTGKRPNQHS